LNFKSEVFFHVFYDHDQKRELDTQSIPRIFRATYVVGAHIGAHYFQHAGLNVLVCAPFDVPILYWNQQAK
jgi:hypothetical protein